MDEKTAKRIGYMVVAASFLAVFCLFGYRSTFSVLQGPMAKDMGWTTSQTSLGYSLMMTVYAITAFFSGMIIDRWGNRPAYLIGAVFAALGYLLTSKVQAYWQYLLVYALFAGIGTGMLWVSSTVSVRKWYVGRTYATMWGIAFAGAPIAQVVLSLGVKPILLSTGWRAAMEILAVVVFVALILAGILARKNPEGYGLKPFGLTPGAAAAKDEHNWSLKEAFGNYAIWGTILAFLTAMVAEFLVWTQVVRFWTEDAKLDLSTATNLYVAIGLAGIITMPLMGVVADKLVAKFGIESKARKTMLIIAPICGIAACILLLVSLTPGATIVAGLIACILFAVYWAIEPGGCAGYAGSVYGRKTLGKIWGFATLIVMGIGPAVGSFMGGYLFDVSGTYRYSIIFALSAFVISAIVASTLPLAAQPKTAVVKAAEGAPAD
jgi:OFA family oxalate/formate antiporter-like MFS transporter